MKPYKILNEKLAHTSKLFKLFTRRLKSENGNEADFDVIKTVDWAHIIPIDKDGYYYLTKQYRAGSNEINLEFPGGAIEKDENPLSGAARELKEEMGLTGKMELIGKLNPNPAFMSNYCYFYLASNVEKKFNLNLDYMEEVETVKVSKEEIKSLINEGKITHSLSLAAIGLLSIKS